MNKRKSVGRNNRKLTGGFTDEKKARWHLAILAGLLLFGLLPNTKILAHATSLYTASFANILAPNSITSTSSITVLNNGDVGIGVSPDTKLDVDGQIKIRGGSPDVGKVLAATSTDGLASWQSLSDISDGGGAGSWNGDLVGTESFYAHSASIDLDLYSTASHVFIKMNFSAGGSGLGFIYAKFLDDAGDEIINISRNFLSAEGMNWIFFLPIPKMAKTLQMYAQGNPFLITNPTLSATFYK